MKIIDILRINLKKLKFRTSKAMFLIVPITVLVALTIIISSQITNIRNATNASVFGKIDNENTVLQITKQEEQSTQSFRGFQPPTQFNEGDLSAINSIENVDNASLNYSLPITSVKTNDLFSDTTLNLTNISILDSDMASTYTTEDFTYTEGNVIPVIVNANSLVQTYEDWGGKTTMTVNMRGAMESGQDPRQITPVKTKAIEYSKEELIGKEFTITVGGFDALNTYEITRDAGVMTFTQLTTSEVSELETERKDAINEYWKYDNLKNGKTYTLKVVGIIESDTNRSNYIPTEFANTIMSDLISLEISNRRSTLNYEIASSNFSGLSYDGSELSSNAGGRAPQGMPGTGGGFSRTDPSMQSATSTHSIPGLVLLTDSEDSSTVTGLNKDYEVFEKSVKTSSTISIKINSNENREQVVNDINDAGYALVDVNNLDVFSNIQTTLSSISSWLVIFFILLTTGVIILTMSKFVSESTKEIGIFRAVGFTKGNILSIFLVQGIMYTLIGYIFGLGIGYIGNILSSQFIANWFNTFLEETIAKTYAVVELTNSSMFMNIDYNSLVYTSIIIITLAIIISFIPAYKASNISPIEAIKSE